VTTPVLERTAPEQTNERVELARYTITAGERVIYGQRIRGVVRLVDVPAQGSGRRYLIERELTSMAELEAIVADYLREAARWDAIPAAGPALARRRARPGAAAMSAPHDRDPGERPELSERDLALATLVGRYIERREQGDSPLVHDLLAVAHEFGAAAADELREVLAFYEALRAAD
jgi:hypothetical protein